MKLKQKVGLWVLKYLRYFAKLKLKQIKPEIIGITGSAGKTGCLKAVTTVLQDKFPTKSSLKANSESGIPLNILGIRPGNFSVFDWLRMIMLAPIKYLFNQDKYEKYVVEMGIDSAKSPKNMAYLLTIIKPQIAVWLNVLPVHTVNFPEGIDGIAREKGKLLESLPPNGYAVINRDDELIRPFLLKTKAKIIGISLKADNWQDHPEDISLTGWQLTDRSTVFSFYQSNREVTIKLAGWHPQELGLSLAAGLAVGVIEGLDFEESANGLTKNFSQEPGRSSLIEGKNGSLIIDSSYNASPEAVKSMLRLLAATPSKKKRAILGDMNELDSESESQSHQDLVKLALGMVDELYLVGPKMRQWGLPQAESIERQVWVRWYATAKAAGEAVANQLGQGEVVLVKGSQNGIFLEQAVAAMMRHPEEADKLLCRRGWFWDKMRNVVY